MKARALAWSLWAMFVIVLISAAIYGFDPPSGEPIRIIDALWAASFIGFPTTGALIASRLPERPLGWLFCIAPLVTMIAVLLGDIAVRSAVSQAAADWMAWTSNVLFTVGLAMLLFTPMLLPAGAPDSRVDRVLARVMVGCAAGWTLSAALAPGSLMEVEGFTNPIGVDALDGLFTAVMTIMWPLLFASFLASIVSLVVRYRRSHGQERLQLKSVAFAAASIPILFGAVFLVERFVDLGDLPVTLVFMFVIIAIPTSIAIAMLRYRLYEIDQVINRALVYALLTATLVAIYLGFVVGLQAVMGPVTGDSDLAVAASTLAAAALFRPLRAHIQGFIDRRFYRRKYDARRALATFGTHLRNEVELANVQQAVLGLLNETVQPSHAAIWLRRKAVR